MPAVGGNAVTPMKRVPILANFEEWMKMATDNVGNSRLLDWEGTLTSAENQRSEFVELCADRLLSRHVAFEGRRWGQLSAR